MRVWVWPASPIGASARSIDRRPQCYYILLFVSFKAPEQMEQWIPLVAAQRVERRCPSASTLHIERGV